ncbi:hypothetical protein CHARACLAT_010597 [Characodon lateralis]|uniref:Uncharacterized protein n=1 Tax=Characodon lateralis TaxID=208331 RepID=A0ABU7DTN7_9TELE|nr:hypothetical protein [Characodon lateralis]
MGNGDLRSPSSMENEVDEVTAVNGECSHNTDVVATHGEECVNGNEKLEERPVEEQADFELKKDVNLCGDVQEVPDTVSGMVEGLGTEVTQAV